MGTTCAQKCANVRMRVSDEQGLEKCDFEVDRSPDAAAQKYSSGADAFTALVNKSLLKAI